ncbi:E3 ubiquitin-protein ligase RNF169 [Takifugu flavidus]|nr:E3 ubiquitin-protein ligase RNF169 [Takifugu flavidus]
MATVGSSEPGCPPCPAAKVLGVVEGQPDCRPPPAHPATGTQRHICFGERLHRRSDPEKSSTQPGRKDCDSRRGLLSKCDPLTFGKHKLLFEDREEMKRRNPPCAADQEPGVLSDSENEEPISGRVQSLSAFTQKTKAWSGFRCFQRSQSCTNASEDQGCKRKSASQPPPQPPPLDHVTVGHSYAAGILLSSENSGSASALATVPERRVLWRTAVVPSGTPLALSLPRPERSISPDSNDSISEEFNHFKPIVCSPCTPPKRLPDGRLVEPTIVKSTPRNLSGGLQKATSYEASPAVLQKWRQIEVDRQNIRLNSKATLTSPGIEPTSATCQPPGRCGDGATAGNKRKLMFEMPAVPSDSFQKHSVKVQVPAIRVASDSKLGVPGTCGGTVMFGCKQSPYSRTRGCHTCKDSPGPWKQAGGRRHPAASQRGRKREQKTKHLDSDQDFDRKRSLPVGKDTRDERYISRVQLERRDRALAVTLQRQFDLDNYSGRRSADTYCLRSWMSTRRRYSLRSSRRLNQKL